jgi:hypothetical protein
VKRIKNQIKQIQNSATGETTKRTTDDSQSQNISNLDIMLLETISAYRKSPVIGFKDLYEIIDGRFGATLQDIKTSLIHLINKGKLPGYLTLLGYAQNTHVSIQCQICDQEVDNPVIFWQCPDCFRYVCSSCKVDHSSCPSHIDPQSRLVKMPKKCDSCGTSVYQLKGVKNQICLSCQGILYPSPSDNI